MPIAAQPNSPPSDLSVVLGQVGDLFAAVGDATPIMIGKKYLEDFGAGAGPRVLFVPESRGKLGPPIENGNVASITHSCDFYVRAPEDGSDLGRFVAAYKLVKRVLSALRRAASGRLELGDFADDSPVDVDAFGADLACSFTYQSDVQRDGAIWGVPSAAPDLSPPQPIQQPGQPALNVELDVSVAQV